VIEWWSDEPETDLITCVLLVSTDGNGGEVTGGERTLDAWPRDMCDMVGEVGADATAFGDCGVMLSGDLGDLGDSGGDLGDVDPGGATTLFLESDSGEGLCAARDAGIDGIEFG
jgi:hypothetical protein